MKDRRYNARIIAYYRRSAWLYKYFWYSQNSLGMHCGFWDEHTKTNDEALINQYKYIVEKTKIKKDMRVLDAGCGVGGGAIYIARRTGARVVGITISPEQVREASKNARKARVDKLATFSEQDFTKTSFPSNFFDVIFAIESVGHAYSKYDFLKEAYRILKPGGRLIINDGYSNYLPRTDKEKELVRQLCRGWQMHELMVVADMSRAVRKAGFRGLLVQDQAKAVRPTLRSIDRLVNLFKPLFLMTKSLRWEFFQSISDNIQSLATISEGDKIGVFGYYSHIARK